MQSYAVVEAHAVISDIGHRFIVVGIVFLSDPLHLQVQKEALHDSVDPPMSSRRLGSLQKTEKSYAKPDAAVVDA